MPKLNHFNDQGQAHMVDVSSKKITSRIAVAKASIIMNSDTLEIIINGSAKKGDVLGIARTAGIMAAKKTSELIPLCHPLPITNVNIDLNIEPSKNSVEITVPKAMLGVGRYFPINSFGVLASADLIFSFDGKRNTLAKSDFASFDAAIGLEVNYKKLVFLRGGAGKVQEVKDFDESTYMTFQPNFGIGFNIKGAVIDYALTDIGDQSESLYSHVFSIKAGLNKK